MIIGDDPAGELAYLGGGWYGLPDGRRIHGRAEAHAAVRGVDDEPDDEIEDRASRGGERPVLRRIGAGSYELPDGRRIRGREAAERALEA